jgi:hypothetical protein
MAINLLPINMCSRSYLFNHPVLAYKLNLKDVRREAGNCIILSQNRDQWWASLNIVIDLSFNERLDIFHD